MRTDYPPEMEAVLRRLHSLCAAIDEAIALCETQMPNSGWMQYGTINRIHKVLDEARSKDWRPVVGDP